MNRAIEIWNSSILGRVLTAICLWFSGQWQRSRVVRAFVAPMAGRQAAESSVFFRLWDLIRGGLCALYRRLGLERLFGGSIFLRLTLWCSAPVVLPVALVALYFVLPDTVISRFTSIGNLEDTSTSYRVSIWMGTIAMLKDYWLCGIGPGTGAFNLVYPAYSYNAANAQHAHNLFLQIMSDGGVVALVVFLLIIFIFCRVICSALSRNRSWRARCYLAGAIGGVGGFMAQSMTDYTFYNYRVALLFFAVLALGASFARLAEQEVEDR